MSDTIRLDPVLFDALHLSALANDGIGRSRVRDGDRCPHCAVGHAMWLDDVEGWRGTTAQSLLASGFLVLRADGLIARAGVGVTERVPFERWIEIVNVDVAA